MDSDLGRKGKGVVSIGSSYSDGLLVAHSVEASIFATPVLVELDDNIVGRDAKVSKLMRDLEGLNGSLRVRVVFDGRKQDGSGRRSDAIDVMIPARGLGFDSIS